MNKGVSESVLFSLISVNGKFSHFPTSLLASRDIIPVSCKHNMTTAAWQGGHYPPRYHVLRPGSHRQSLFFTQFFSGMTTCMGRLVLVAEDTSTSVHSDQRHSSVCVYRASVMCKSNAHLRNLGDLFAWTMPEKYIYAFQDCHWPLGSSTLAISLQVTPQFVQHGTSSQCYPLVSERYRQQW